MALPQSNDYYTFSDYMSWDSEERYELINGVPYMMATPSRRHQEAVGEIFGQLREFLKGKPCRPFVSPFGVRLNALGNDDDTVVEPDIVVVCDHSKLDDKGCNGAPDFIVEVLSPSSGRMDKFIKFQKYQKAGVREYWIVDLESKTVSANTLENGKYFNTAYAYESIANVHIFEGCQIVLKDVFAET